MNMALVPCHVYVCIQVYGLKCDCAEYHYFFQILVDLRFALFHVRQTYFTDMIVVHVNTNIFQKQNNSLAPGRYGSNCESIIFKLTKRNSRLSTRCEIDSMWIMQNLSK